MSLPWLPEVDPSELLSDDTKWEEHDELTLYKQCILRGVKKSVEKEGDPLCILNFLTHSRLKWCTRPEDDLPGIYIPDVILGKKALKELLQHLEKKSFQVIHITDTEADSGKKIVLSNATVEIGTRLSCSCGLSVCLLIISSCLLNDIGLTLSHHSTTQDFSRAYTGFVSISRKRQVSHSC